MNDEHKRHDERDYYCCRNKEHGRVRNVVANYTEKNPWIDEKEEGRKGGMANRIEKSKQTLIICIAFASRMPNETTLRENGHFSLDSFWCNLFISFVDRNSQFCESVVNAMRTQQPFDFAPMWDRLVQCLFILFYSK